MYLKRDDIKEIKKLIPFLKNDKKNNDNKINFILLKKLERLDNQINTKYLLKI